MNAAAASCLAMTNGGLFSILSMFWANFYAQVLVSRAAHEAEPHGSDALLACHRSPMPGRARPDKRQTTHRSKVSLRRAGRPIGNTSETPRTLSCRARLPDHATDAAVILRTITAPLSQCAALIDPAHHYRTEGVWFSRQYDARSNTPIKTARICRRGFALGKTAFAC